MRRQDWDIKCLQFLAVVMIAMNIIAAGILVVKMASETLNAKASGVPR